MKIKMNYGNGVIALPACVLGKMSSAAPEYLPILLALAAHPELLEQEDGRISRLAQMTGCDASIIPLALEYWRGAGILTFVKEKGKENVRDTVETVSAPEPSKPERTKVLERANELPSYSSAEVVSIMEKRKDAAMLIRECETTLGRVFNPHETSIVLGMLDYLNLDGEYILTLCAHFKALGVDSLRYIEKAAINYCDNNIRTTPALIEKLRLVEKEKKLETRIRSLFGLSERALSKKEAEYLVTWTEVYRYGEDIIEYGFEVMVDSIGKASFGYLNKILTSWYEQEVRSLDDAKKSVAERKNRLSPSKGSFQTDDFFEAALKRSYGGNKPER